MSFWKRLLGKTSPAPSPGSDCATAEDRRVWVRYPADLETTYQPATESGGARLSARVRNVSLGGVNLVVDREFTPGDLLSVELPGVADRTRCTVLACVVHVAAQGDGTWSLGCTFARELNEEDLEAFGVQRVRHASTDQRTWMRFPSDIRASFHPVAETDMQPREAGVLNVSASGIGLLVPQPVENGTLLSVELRSARGTFQRTMLACVVHVTAQSDGSYALGCNFIRSLSEDELKALL